MPLPSNSKFENVQNIRSRILVYLAEKGYPISPSEIAQKLSISSNSVRPRLLELLREGKISRPNRGFYLNKPIHGVEDKLPTVHNLIMKKSGYRFSRKIPDFRYTFGCCSLKIQYGLKNGNLMWYVICEEGLDFVGLLLVLDVLRRESGRTLNMEILLDDFELSTIEMNQDYQWVRWDRKGCITIKSFLGPLERIYQKGPVLRSEVKVKPQSLTDIYLLLKGGVTPYNVVQTQMMSVRLQEGLTKQNERLLSYMITIIRYMKTLVERI